MDKPFNCEACRRPIRHHGFCLPCNIKKLNATGSSDNSAHITRKKNSCDKCGFQAMYKFYRCQECGALQEETIKLGQETHVLQGKSGITKFPFPSVRSSQTELMKDVRHAVENREHLIADAPTGLGKTIGVIFPALEFAVESKKNVFFLTSRLSQHKMVVETLKLMKDAGNNFTAVDIVGKKHLCSHDVADMDSSIFSSFCSAMVKDKRCSYYKNSKSPETAGDRMHILLHASINGPMGTQEAMQLISGRYCTYEMLMDAAKGADIVVGDYFHVFGMADKLMKRTGKQLSETVIIVDEAHNLSARLRASLSSRLSTRTCELAAREAQQAGESDVRAIIVDIGKAVQNLGKKYLFNENEVFVIKDELIEKISELGDYDKIIESLTRVAEHMLEERKVSFIDRVANFLHAWKGGDYGYARILSRHRIRGKDHIGLEYNCLDPSLISRSIIAESHSTILMSGTLSPMKMHRDLLGMEPGRTAMKSYESPFPKANRKNIIVNGITTRYTERNEKNFLRIADVVACCIHAIKGNCAVFFPSYEIRDKIYKIVYPRITKHTMLEDSTMTKDERDRVKEQMREHAEGGCVLFGVLAGSFSEGIDMPGELLNGVVVVGLPLEKPSLGSKALIDYYEQRFQRGMSYGYIYPAMIKVMQAAGRCIRTENDRGVIVFADERFAWRNYRYVFPRSWDFTVAEAPEKEIVRFFSG